MSPLPASLRSFRRDSRAYGVAWWLKYVFRFQVVAPLLKAFLRPSTSTPLVRLGTMSGGWWVPETVLQRGAVAYCAGAGDDISFDLSLYARHMRVVTLDPTPRALAHVETVAPKSQDFVVLPIGLWDEMAELKFFSPRNLVDIDYSIVNLQGTEDYFVGRVKTLREVMNDLGDPVIHVLKLDIEGAEHKVIHSLIDDGIRPDVLCVEFDQPSPLRSILSSIRRLRTYRYSLAHIETWNYTFIRDPAPRG